MLFLSGFEPYSRWVLPLPSWKSQISPILWDGRAQIWRIVLKSFYFPDVSQISAMVGDHSR